MVRQSPRHVPCRRTAQTTWGVRLVIALCGLGPGPTSGGFAAEPAGENAAPVRGRVYVIPLPPGETRPVTLQLEARTSNWDADAEHDGIELRVLPLSESGEVVPLEGLLNVTLSAQKSRVERARESPWAALGTWPQRVRPQDFGTRGAVYRFPFQRVDPTQGRKFAVGQIEATLSTFRAGRLHASSELRMPRFDSLGGLGTP